VKSWLPRLGWLILVLPALWQLWLLGEAIAGRYGYGYDLEWMEGGLLHHALRIGDGDGIYGPPSVDFIPYLYTPLYPGLVALLGAGLGISYQLGRAISILSLIGIGAVAAFAIAGPTYRRSSSPASHDRCAAWAGVAVALGLFAAGYPWVEGWYDLVRADSLFLFLITIGLHTASRWARSGHGPVAACAAILALAFFTKQTGILYVAGGGAMIAAQAWRKAPTFAAVAGVIGLGGTWILQLASDGWFWIYVHDVHQAHDFNMDRFWKSFGNILWHFPVLTIAVIAGVIAVTACAIVRRAVPAPAQPFLIWAPIFALSTLVGAVGWGTEFAHFNAYMPALLHGAIAAGAAVPAVTACVRALAGDGGDALVGTMPASRVLRGPLLGALAGAALTAALSVQLYRAGWNPRKYIPTAADDAAATALVQHIASIDGEVWLPSHPWYGHLAGKRMYVHRMGIKDVTVRKPRPIAGLDEALRQHRFAAIIVDGPRDVHAEVPVVARYYRPETGLLRNERPKVYTGAKVEPDFVWVPATAPHLPEGARALFDFESGNFDGWERRGAAWGAHPEMREVTGQGQVRGFGGRYFATSMHGGDAATGTLLSPPFAVDGNKISLRLGGGSDLRALRAELRIGTDVAVVATPPSPPSELFSEVEWDVSGLRGKTARIALVDEGTGGWGHLNVDEIWLWQ